MIYMQTKNFLSFGLLLICLSLTLSSLAAPKAKRGQQVLVQYTGTVDDGIIFDSNYGQSPLIFTIGDSSVLKAFEDAVLGMRVGESKTFTIPADYAYGPSYPNKILQIPRAQIPASLEIKEALTLKLESPEGALSARIIEIGADTVYLDANHLLAGKDLTFKLKLLAAQ